MEQVIEYFWPRAHKTWQARGEPSGREACPYSITRRPRRAPVGGVPTLTTRAHMNQPEKSTRHLLRCRGRHRIAEAGAAQAELRAQERPCEARSGRVRRRLPSSSSFRLLRLRPPVFAHVEKKKCACLHRALGRRVGFELGPPFKGFLLST